MFSKLLSLICLLCLSIQSSQAYYFATDMKTKISELSEKQIKFQVIEIDNKDDDEVFPVNSIISGTIKEKIVSAKPAKSAKYFIQLKEAQLPNGEVQKLDQELILKPSLWIGLENFPKPFFISGGIIPSVLVSFALLPIGFVARGIWQGAYDSYYAVENKKWTKGFKGFVRGATEPISFFFVKGDDIEIQEGQEILILDAKAKKDKITAVPMKLNGKGRYGL